MKIQLACVCLALSGCVLCPPKEPVVVVKEVFVPTVVKCTLKEPLPLEKVPSMGSSTSLYERTVLLIKELEAHRARSKELEAALIECADFK